MPGRLAPSLSSFSALHFNLVESLRISFQSSDLNMPVGGRKGYPRSREVPTPGKIREAGGVQSAPPAPAVAYYVSTSEKEATSSPLRPRMFQPSDSLMVRGTSTRGTSRPCARIASATTITLAWARFSARPQQLAVWSSFVGLSLIGIVIIVIYA